MVAARTDTAADAAAEPTQTRDAAKTEAAGKTTNKHAPPSAPSAKAAARESRRAQLESLFADLGVDTGDVVIFDRKCASMNAYGGAICASAKFFGRTKWDHNGVVIRDPETRELLFLEASLTGVKLRPLVERVLRSQSHEVAVRQLQVARPPEFHARAMEFATQILDSPYEDRPQRLFNAGVQAPARLERERLFHALIAHKKALQRLDSEIEHRLHMPAFERNALVKERDAVHERYHELVQALSQRERSVFENELLAQPTTRRKMFCSQLVAALYQHLGLLLPYPSANSYLPKHFSTGDKDQYLKLHADATLLPEVSLRKKLEENVARRRRLAEEAVTRGPGEQGGELATIVQCLRRHQLFHALSESELLALARQFRRRELNAGEVVFYQGETGDFFYIIQDGECDVFVDYNYLRDTPTHEEETLLLDGGDNGAAEPLVPLRRRKTLALPDFNSSSSLIGKNQRVHVATNGPGTAFGDSALIYETPRRATIQAAPLAKTVVLWQLEKPAFRRVVDEHPSTQCSMEEYLFLMQTLSEHALFAELDDRAKALAVRKCFPLQFRAGTPILNQGDSGDYFYLIESGTCEISRRKPRLDAPVVDRRIGRGASFGEAALLYNSRRGASVVAVEDTKVWCMDRAAFLTITRSGSSALFSLFKKLSSTARSADAYITERDLQRMLRTPPTAQAQVDTNLKTITAVATERAVQLARSLLFHDASGLVNFSQFAHFHIALGASNTEQLLPEAAFRILNELATQQRDQEQRVDDRGKEVGSTSTPLSGDQSAIEVGQLAQLMAQWTQATSADDRSGGEVATTAKPTASARLELYQRLFDLPAGASTVEITKHRVSCDDIARAIASLAEDDSTGGDAAEDVAASTPAATVAALREVTAFLATLRHDLDALRDVWRAAEFHAGTRSSGDGTDSNFSRGKHSLTFDANLRSGWISAIRVNPMASDWDLAPATPPLSSSMEMRDEVTTVENNANLHQQRVARATSLAAAIAAGALSRTVCAPLERLKILMQSAVPTPTPASGFARLLTSPYTSLLRGLRNMVALGGARSLFSGNLAHCLWLVPSLPTKFLLCDVYQGRLDIEHTTAQAPQAASTSALRNVLAGGLAGLTANCLLYPLDVVRARLSVQQYYSRERPYTGIRDAFAQMQRVEGARAFYRGFGPASAGVFTYIGCNYAAYEALRPFFVLYDDADEYYGLDGGGMARDHLAHPSVPGQMLCAAAASVLSQTLAFPFDVLRRRMQVGGAWHGGMALPTYTSTWQCLRATLREGDTDGDGRRTRLWTRVARLYRGLGVNCVKVVPSTVVAFVSFEKMREMRLDDMDDHVLGV